MTPEEWTLQSVSLDLVPLVFHGRGIVDSLRHNTILMSVIDSDWNSFRWLLSFNIARPSST